MNQRYIKIIPAPTRVLGESLDVPPPTVYVPAMHALESNLEMLQRVGVEFDYFVDSAEGPHIELDSEVVSRRTESARKRLGLSTGLEKTDGVSNEKQTELRTSL